MTRSPRYHETGKHSFFGDYVYERIIPKDHFLVALNELFAWDKLADTMIGLYKGKGLYGRPPYNPVLVFKMLLLSYVYDVSERDIERLATYHLAMKWFLGLAVDEAPPDHSTLTKFKNRFVKRGNWLVLQKVFDAVIQEAVAHGLKLGDLQLLDSVHTRADVNNEKDRKRQEQGRAPRDPDARVVHKGKRTVVEPGGKSTKKDIRYNGYKAHVSMDAKSGVVTTVHCTRGNAADNKAFPTVFSHDRDLGLPTKVYGGDRAYDDTNIYEYLEEARISIGIHLRDVRTSKKDANKERWIELLSSPDYQRAVALRYRVEQPFGWAKHKHGFERCRYIGLARYRIQAFLTFLVTNCRRIVKLLTGLTLRTPAKGRSAEVFEPVYTSLPWA
jgi:IS5 family transposase